MTHEEMCEAWRLHKKKHLNKKWPKWSWMESDEGKIFGAFDDLMKLIYNWFEEMQDRYGGDCE